MRRGRGIVPGSGVAIAAAAGKRHRAWPGPGLRLCRYTSGSYAKERIRDDHDPRSRPRIPSEWTRLERTRVVERPAEIEDALSRSRIAWSRGRFSRRRAGRGPNSGMIRVFLVEDEPPALRKLERLVAGEPCNGPRYSPST